MELIKHRVAHYWSHRAEAFEAQRLREFDSEKRARWLAEFFRYLPQGRPLRVLDIGTGTGFFACLFAAEGHEATGIDLTPDMIKHAEHMAAVLGLDATFRIMDAENPDFEPESFDVLVTRNLTWTLPHVEKAYREWYRILKPGGVLINFDADYSATLEDEQQGGEKHELPENHAHKLVPDDLMAENNAITMEIDAYHGRARSGTCSCSSRPALSVSPWTKAFINASMPRSTSSSIPRRSSPLQLSNNRRGTA